MEINPGQTRQEYYEKLLEQKKEELTAVLRQQGKALSDIDKVRLNRQAEELLQEIEKLESQISNIKKTFNKNHIENQLEKSLQKIDFNQARKIAESLKQQYEKEGGAILLFLHKSKKQLGKYCVEEFIDIITSNQIGTCPRRTIDFDSPTYTPNKDGFIHAISGYLGITVNSELEQNEEQLLSEIHNKISSSLSLGDNLFFEIRSINRLNDKEEFISWFIQRFWNTFIINNQSSLQQKRNRLIFALIANSKFTLEPDNIYFCQEQEVTLNHDKMIKIPLLDWSVEDISNWLISHYKLFPRFANRQNLNCDQIYTEAKNIHEETDGTPESVCLKLKEYFYEQN